MKLAAAEKISLEGTPTRCPPQRAELRKKTLVGPPTRCPEPELPFFQQVSDEAHIAPKQWRYDLRVSKTLVTGYLNGSKPCPFTRAQRALGVIAEKHPELKVAVLTYVAGGEEKLDEALFARLQEVFSKSKKED